MTEKKTLADGRKLYGAKAGKPAAEPAEPNENDKPRTLAAGAQLYKTKNNK
ncbi:hypothetical protein ABC337_11480 [Arthrobacter sp. 1P04PC]|uniref:hypothetical protein n=1 Tax=unclassified Arthrobacter TaxID=235627 RepID=UPI0039A0CBC2